LEIEITAKIDVYDVLDEINMYKADFREAYLLENKYMDGLNEN